MCSKKKPHRTKNNTVHRNLTWACCSFFFSRLLSLRPVLNYMHKTNRRTVLRFVDLTLFVSVFCAPFLCSSISFPFIVFAFCFFLCVCSIRVIFPHTANLRQYLNACISFIYGTFIQSSFDLKNTRGPSSRCFSHLLLLRCVSLRRVCKTVKPQQESTVDYFHLRFRFDDFQYLCVWARAEIVHLG